MLQLLLRPLLLLFVLLLLLSQEGDQGGGRARHGTMQGAGAARGAACRQAGSRAHRGGSGQSAATARGTPRKAPTLHCQKRGAARQAPQLPQAVPWTAVKTARCTAPVL